MKPVYNDIAHKAAAEYAREYRKRNPERMREIKKRYWEKRAENGKNREKTGNSLTQEAE